MPEPSRIKWAKSNRKIDTKPEIALRSALHQRGLRFRKNKRISTSGLSVVADVVFPRSRLAVFVDGCFWHSCPDHGNTPASNRSYWIEKLRRNVRRDREVDRALRSIGWTVVRIWEHEDPSQAAGEIHAIKVDLDVKR